MGVENRLSTECLPRDPGGQSGKLVRMTSRMLVLLRHAKAVMGRPDIDRPLSSRGHADAAAAGAWLGAQDHRPDLVICSPARRTRQTWHAVAVALSDTAGDRPAPHVRYDLPVYNGGAAELLGLVQTVPDDLVAVLLIGHNPTISQLSALLDPDAGLDSEGLRTGGIAVYEVTTPWPTCGTHPARLISSHTARG
jgi:phosphohistidine phosphatase